MDKFQHPFLQKIQSHNLQLPSLIYDDTQYSYEDLLRCVKEKMTILKTIPNGSCVGIIGDYDLDSIAFMLANLERGNIIAPFTSQNKTEIEKKIIEGQIDFVYSDNKITSITKSVTKHNLIKSLQENHTNGLILFSSGSTGKPKAIVHNLDNILQTYLYKRSKKMNILLFLMFDHIGGLNTLFNVFALGGCGVAVKNRKDVDLLAKTLQDYHIFMLPASPSLLNLMLLGEVHKKFDLSALKFITYGTEKMPDTLLQKLKREFPNVRFHQTFGASEVGITQTTSHNNAMRLQNIDYKIINNELYLKSKTQSLGYLNADNNVFDSDGYFATGDLVEVTHRDGKEYITILGRTKELINVGGEKVLPAEVESVILQIPFIKDCLVYAEANAITGQSVSVKVVLDVDNFSNIELKKHIRMYCKDKLANFKIPTKVVIVDNLIISERFKKVRI